MSKISNYKTDSLTYFYVLIFILDIRSHISMPSLCWQGFVCVLDK